MVYDDLVRQGKLRYVALSNHPAWQVTGVVPITRDIGLTAEVAHRPKARAMAMARSRA